MCAVVMHAFNTANIQTELRIIGGMPVDAHVLHNVCEYAQTGFSVCAHVFTLSRYHESPSLASPCVCMCGCMLHIYVYTHKHIHVEI
jgi:hypothetical protein